MDCANNPSVKLKLKIVDKIGYIDKIINALFMRNIWHLDISSMD